MVCSAAAVLIMIGGGGVVDLSSAVYRPEPLVGAVAFALNFKRTLPRPIRLIACIAQALSVIAVAAIVGVVLMLADGGRRAYQDLEGWIWLVIAIVLSVLLVAAADGFRAYRRER